MNMTGLLVIIPCGQGKIWDRYPEVGPTPARDAYTGAPFRVNRAYAERFASRWVILSAKYGFIDPDFVIPEPYNLTFKKKDPRLVEVSRLREQVSALGLAEWPDVAVLGGKEYQSAARAAFAGMDVALHYPLAGLPLGRAMSATNAAISAGRPLPDGPSGKMPLPAVEVPRVSSPPTLRPTSVRPGKYTPLTEFLRQQEAGRVTLSFEEIENIIGTSLPASARTYAAWWSTDASGSHRWVNDWEDAGWKVETLSLGRERVVFVRRF